VISAAAFLPLAVSNQAEAVGLQPETLACDKTFSITDQLDHWPVNFFFHRLDQVGAYGNV
jgi:hypothetical protein